MTDSNPILARQLTEREHIILRPAMYLGAVDMTKIEDFHLVEDQIIFTEKSYVPALIKSINEIIDNCVDVAIKTKFKTSNEIEITIKDNICSVADNGTGIPVVKNGDGIYNPDLCWGYARAGSNFDDDKNRDHMGMNGVGSFATNCFSKNFRGITDDSKKTFNILYTENALKSEFKLSKSSGKTGTTVTFELDLEKFNVDAIDQVHIDIIKHRLVDLKASFPLINFKLNGKRIGINTFKKYVDLFSKESVIIKTNQYKFAIFPNNMDDFKHYTYLNGLKLPDGGSHIDYIMGQIVNRLREKIQKKFKNIKPADIKNKLAFVGLFTGFRNPKFNSQAKEKITNSAAEITDYLGDIDYDAIALQIFKTKEFIDPITEIYRIKAEFKRRQDMKGLVKTTKKIKSEKYLPAIGKNHRLFIAEGDSAIGGLSPVLGRNGNGFYALKGLPLNAIQATHQKFVKNVELSELFKICKSEGYTEIIFATDADLDGIHIRGLLMGFFHKYVPEFKGSIGILSTPVKFIKKGKKPIRWTYDINEELIPKSGEIFKYVKGLGTWNTPDLKAIIDKDGLSNMIQMINFDNDELLMSWLDKDPEPRKDFIQNNTFNIAKL